ncbi:HpcH/HpaI aldolase family protein [Sneathiella sp.]|jgi:2-keto-3-deoxy-L-rhamnonate aldolase RhmA|uniref:HpcH/HpaI aldolase family protein n=1 Tax=Sneathiella sp. TaxID=1964365 RepID=UPI0039E21C1C
MNRIGKIKKTLAAGQKAKGCWLFTGSADLAEIIGGAGFDAIMIDHEHGSGNLPQAIDQHRAIRCAGDTSVLMRIPSNDPVAVKRALDAGMEGIMFPAVNTAEQARAAVAACRYPPNGTRGVGLGAARAAAYGRDKERYLEEFEDKLLIICQIESKEAVGNIEEIAAVDGVDMLFIGPYDLSGSIGKPGWFDDPQVIAQFEDARDRIKASGKWLGCISSGAERTNEMFAEGFDFLLCAAETTLVSTGAQELLDQLKS